MLLIVQLVPPRQDYLKEYGGEGVVLHRNGMGEKQGVSSPDQGETEENLGCSGWKYHRRSELLELDGGRSCSRALRVLGQGKALGSL